MSSAVGSLTLKAKLALSSISSRFTQDERTRLERTQRRRHDIPEAHSKTNNTASAMSTTVDNLKSRAKVTINNISDKFFTDEGEPMTKHQIRKKERESRRRERRKVQEDDIIEFERRIHDEEEKAAAEQTPEQRARYGHIDDLDETPEQRVIISELRTANIGETVTFRARLQTTRAKSAALVFCVFRQQTATIQGVLEARGGELTEYMLRWAGRVSLESVVLVSGVLVKPVAPVTGSTIHDIEVRVTSMHVISEAADALPFSVFQAEKVTKLRSGMVNGAPNGSATLDRGASPTSERSTEGDDGNENESDAEHSDAGTLDEHKIPRLSDRTRFMNRIIDLRTPATQAVFRIQAGVCALFRRALDDRGFVEIHTPKLQGGATESGATVFEVSYFGRAAFLAQSPQLAKQMCISADFERVYEIGAVFRAENSNTHRHLTEYTGLDIEMTFERDYHEVMRLIDATIKIILKGVHERYAAELEAVRTMFPSEPLQWVEDTPVLAFPEAIQMLRESGWTDDSEDDDLSTRGEMRLGQLVKEKYGTDYYILDKFPAAARPFYAMKDAANPKFTNTFDIFLRGQEILTGGQRIHDAGQLEEAMVAAHIRPETMEEYLDGFRFGAPPHGGGGFGLERFVMLLLALPDIRNASLFPRDPRSLPPAPPGESLRHPDASTLHPKWADHADEGTPAELPPLPKLIANYGDAPHTAWLDTRFTVWRHGATGAAIGFGRAGHYCIIAGDPLCDQSQYGRVAAAFLRWVREEVRLKPLWILVGAPMAKILGEKMGWRTMTCVAEARVDTRIASAPNAAVAKKIRHAEGEGVEITDIPATSAPAQELQDEVNERLKDWQAARKGKQVHITDLDPWNDPEHRRYFVARDRDGKVCALVVLAELALRHGFQIKWALDFPGAPGGTIEYIVIHAIKAAQEAGASSVTFGATPATQFTAGANLGALRKRMLAKTYSTLAHSLGLLKKSEFKEKLGAEQDPEYICYPPRGLGPTAVRSILKWLGDSPEEPDEKEVGAMSPDSQSRRARSTSPAQRSVAGRFSLDQRNGRTTPRRSVDASRTPRQSMDNGQ